MRRTLMLTCAAALALTACGDDDAAPPGDEVVTDTDADTDTNDADTGEEPGDDEPDGADDEPEDGTDADAADDDGEGTFPVTVTDSRGVDVELEEAPERIVSLSPTHTEILFAVDAGDQVIAVDDQSDHPEEAPTTDLSGFEPNLEAIADEDPDLVIAAFDPEGLSEGLEDLGVDVLILDAPADLEDAYDQWQLVGDATGRSEEATTLVDEVSAEIDELVADAPDTDLRFYHELDEFLYSATSGTFIGQVYDRFGLENIADQADDDEAGGYPQLSEELIFDADPDLIFLAGQGPDADVSAVAERPGWDTITAVQEDNLFEADGAITSRWGPRIVEFVELVGDAIANAE
jgi:iron complex transport system substrate-binding protein